ncbi:MAG: sulfite exporter TauE/SafE family protein [Treponema sp.]|jgi:sulfite exporter TauE/SafE/copper chaperone CopZ|nr:sulfite exporter TauE/SafE family protein [Treponema sp.]
METITIRIGGMSCAHCEDTLEKALSAAEGVAAAKVSYARGTAKVSYEPERITRERIEGVVREAGYTPLGDAAAAAGADGPAAGAARGSGVLRAAGFIGIILAAAMVLRHTGVSFFNAFPTAEAGMGLGMLFVIGLITSVHCLAMCGGINLSQTLRPAEGGGGRKRLRVFSWSLRKAHTPLAKSHSAVAAETSPLIPSLLYNLGRVVSYTATGALVGALGGVVSLSGRARGLVQLAAGVFMVIMGLTMLGLFPRLRALVPRLPRFLTRRLGAAGARSGSPLLVGLLNGLMPCGPLQAMQLYALSTGSAVRGALAMLLFALGTVPLMFGLGALGTFLSSRPAISRRVMMAGALIVAIMGTQMFSQGAALSGLSLAGLLPARLRSSPQAGNAAVRADGGQTVRSTLRPGAYPAITVLAGLPVRWIVDAPEGSINGCNNRMIVPEYGIEHRFRPGENVIEFLPERAGVFRYSCWMGMIRSSITVVEDEAALAAAAGAGAGAPDPLAPGSAGYDIPTEALALAEKGEYQGEPVQRLRVTLGDEGFSPAIAVVEEGLPVEWIIVNESLEDGSAELRVPAYRSRLPLQKQAENTLFFMPQGDFVFSTGDSIFFGYMKTVPDLSAFDAEAVRAEAAAVETLVYPEEFFASGDAGGCCGGGN